MKLNIEIDIPPHLAELKPETHTSVLSESMQRFVNNLNTSVSWSPGDRLHIYDTRIEGPIGEARFTK